MKIVLMSLALSVYLSAGKTNEAPQLGEIQMSRGSPCEVDLYLACEAPKVDGCSLKGSQQTKVHKCVKPPKDERTGAQN